MSPHVVKSSNHYRVVESHDPGKYTPLKLCLQRCSSSIHQNCWPIDDHLLTPHDRYIYSAVIM